MSRIESLCKRSFLLNIDSYIEEDSISILPHNGIHYILKGELIIKNSKAYKDSSVHLLNGEFVFHGLESLKIYLNQPQCKADFVFGRIFLNSWTINTHQLLLLTLLSKQLYLPV